MTCIMKMIVQSAVAASLIAAAGPSHAASATDPSGTWLTEDSRARIRVERCGATLEQICGYIVWMNDAKAQTLKDQYNPDINKRSRPLLGHQLILGLKPASEGRFDGEIYDAENGKTYSVSLWRETPNHLKVKGCMFAVLCSTQTWSQTSDVLPGQLVGMTGDPDGPKADKEWARLPQPKSPTSAKVIR